MPINGTEAKLATNPYCDTVLKCAAPTGAVASPATAEDITKATPHCTAEGQRNK